MAGQSNPFTPITFPALLPLKVSIFTVNMPPPQTQLVTDAVWLHSIWGSVSKKTNVLD